MSWFEISTLGVFAALVWFWLDSIRVREFGVRAARESCQREGVQLLDETVACRRLRPARNDNGHLALMRLYEFEYSGSGHDRYRGWVMLLGTEVVMLDLSAHRAQHPSG